MGLYFGRTSKWEFQVSRIVLTVLKSSLIVTGLTNVRYAPIATKLRIAAK
jgi:hypothetical protein